MNNFKLESLISVPAITINKPLFPTNKINDVYIEPTAWNTKAIGIAAAKHRCIIPVFFASGEHNNREYGVFCRITETPDEYRCRNARFGDYYPEWDDGYDVISLEGLEVFCRKNISGSEDSLLLPEHFYRHCASFSKKGGRYSKIPPLQLVRLFQAASKLSDAQIELNTASGASSASEICRFINSLSLYCAEKDPSMYGKLIRLNLSQRASLLERFLADRAAQKDSSPSMELLRFDSEDDARSYIEAHDYPEAVKRAAKSQFGSESYGKMLAYLTTLANLPWNRSKPACTDIRKIRRVLDENHYGMDQVKDRILENIIVSRRCTDGLPTVLCLVGAPGVGKTSITNAIARALDLPLVKVSMGGQNDARALKGSTRVYVGAECSSILTGILQSRFNNPVVLIDEVEKASPSNDGDPHAALLEILDPSQNKSFMDNYLGVPFDLSKATFICTANDIASIPAPLKDRMEFIFLKPYSLDERTVIFERYVLPSMMGKCRLTKKDVRISHKTARHIVDTCSGEGGARALERAAGRLCRYACVALAKGRQQVIFDDALADTVLRELRKPVLPEDPLLPFPGIADAMAVTAAGDGVISRIECSTAPGSGKLEATGNYRELARGSIEVALNFVKCHTASFGIDPGYFQTHDVYVHYPRTYITQNGNSAGIANVSAIISAVLNKAPACGTVMTGEITLTGRVLEVGGLAQKITGAKKRGVNTIIYPLGNQPEVDALPAEVKAGIKLLPVRHYSEAFTELFGVSEACSTAEKAGQDKHPDRL